MYDLLPNKRTNRGYSLLEMLLALATMTLLFFITTPILKILNEIKQASIFDKQDEIGIYQLQVQLALNQINEVELDRIEYTTAKNECEISLVNNNLISQPGYLCYLRNLEDAYFELREDIVYLCYEKQEEYYEYPIAYWKPGLY